MIMCRLLLFSLLVSSSTCLFSQENESNIFDVFIEIEDLRLTAKLQDDPSEVFETFTNAFVGETLATHEMISSVGGGAGGHSIRSGVATRRISVAPQTNMDPSQVRQATEELLESALSEQGAKIIGRSQSTPPEFFSLFYSIGYRLGAIHCIVVPGDSAYRLMIIVQESPLLDFAPDAKAEQIDDGNSVKPPGDERTP